MTRICQISDIHIRNYKYHTDYRKVFDILYSEVKNAHPDMIVNTGDTVHQKLNLSPACFQMASELIKNLDDIAPQIIILGNHDLSLSNPHKVDAVTPLVETLMAGRVFDTLDVHFYKYSAFDVEHIVTGDVRWHILSLLDKEKWKTIPLHDDKINIALYHGGIAGVKTDAGWTIEHGVKLDTFAKFDYAMLGDIHKPNQIVDDDGRMRYAGSLCQNSFGEADNKGFLLWNIEDKTSYTCEHIHIPNPKPFVSVLLTPTGRLPNKTKIPKDARVRLIAEKNLPLDTVRRVIEGTKIRFKPESVSFLNKPNIGKDEASKVSYMNLRDVSVQERLIKDYLKDYELTDEVLKKVYEINSIYNAKVTAGMTNGNVRWRINKFKFKNLFNYGDGNEVDFAKLKGVVGLFGKNFSGKSSIIDSLLYTIFNSTSKNIRKNHTIVNQHKQDAFGEVELEIDGSLYRIRRTSEKYIKRLNGQETEEATTKVDFVKIVGEDEFTQNGMTRNDTDKIIRDKLGTLDDFLLTSLSAQFGFLSFVNEGSTKRKEILAKFLDLELFEKKFQLANKDTLSIKGALRNLEGKEYDLEIEEKQFFLDNVVKKELPSLGQQKEEIQIDIENVELQAELKQADLDDIPEDIQDYSSIKRTYKQLERDVNSLVEKTGIQQDLIDAREQEHKKVKSELNGMPAGEDLTFFAGMRDHLHNCQKKVKLLKEVPCDKEFDHCKFKVAAVKALSEIPGKQESLSEHCSSLGVEENYDVDSAISRQSQLEQFDRDYSKELLQRARKIGSLRDTLKDKSHEFDALTEKIAQFEEKQEILDNYEGIKADIDALQSDLTKKQVALKNVESQMFLAYQEKGSLEQKINDLESGKHELSELRKEYEAYDLFLRAFHSNGISYSIIRQNLPVINEEIAKVLMNVVSFEVYFESNNKKLDILIKHPKHDPRLIETASGAEKTLAAVAIRLAFIKASALPQSNIFVLDEPASSLDEQHLDGFTKILETLKVQFDTIILISHLEHLKDFVDEQIVIEKEGGYAKVQI